MARVFKFPFSIGLNGRVAMVQDGSDELVNQRLAVLLLTRLGELPLAPGFGTSDPLFFKVDPAEVRAGVATFGPPGIVIDDVTTAQVTESEQRVTVNWHAAEAGDEAGSPETGWDDYVS